MRLRTLVLLAVIGIGGLGFASDAEAQRHPRRSTYRSYRPAPRYYDYRYSRPYRYNYGYRPYSYGYGPFSYGYSYAPYYYEPYYYWPRPFYRPYYRPRVGISLHLGW